jgi:hypothetical protein
MAEELDPYYQWLGIPRSHQPPTHYRLLAIEEFEDRRDVIGSAADRQIARVTVFRNGPHGEVAERVLNEISAAKACLRNAERKAEYDDTLRAQKKATEPPARGQRQPCAESPQDIEPWVMLGVGVVAVIGAWAGYRVAGYLSLGTGGYLFGVIAGFAIFSFAANWVRELLNSPAGVAPSKERLWQGGIAIALAVLMLWGAWGGWKEELVRCSCLGNGCKACGYSGWLVPKVRR